MLVTIYVNKHFMGWDINIERAIEEKLDIIDFFFLSICTGNKIFGTNTWPLMIRSTIIG